MLILFCFVCWHNVEWVVFWMFWRKMVLLCQPWIWRCVTVGTQFTSTWCQHLKTDLTLFPARKLTWQAYRLWYTSSVVLSCENYVWRLLNIDWIWLEIRYWIWLEIRYLHDTSLIWCQIEWWWMNLCVYVCVCMSVCVCVFRTRKLVKEDLRFSQWWWWMPVLLECYNW
jgi:hypothetical protein